MPKADDKKPLAAWPDDQKHQATDPKQEDENSVDEIEDTAKDDSDNSALDNTQNLDMYKNAKEDQPVELDIVGEIQKAEDEQK